MRANPFLGSDVVGTNPFFLIKKATISAKISLFCLIFGVAQLPAQGFETVFPGLSGAELIDSVARNYRPDIVLDYGQARDTLFAKILAIDDDTLRCIYSGHALYLDPTQDPTQYVFQGGGPSGINTEHSYPQSKGAADGNARSDMHHLYPARVPVNEARGSVPFANIPDAQTQKWFIRNQFFTSIPTTNIDGYSESRTDAFEPRESVKGDIARSIFYFYTMYRAQANAADPNFFDIQRPTLCQWAYQDFADSIELRKTWRIAPYQSGKPNPFVLDCSLAKRCWCPEIQANCFVSTSQPPLVRVHAWPNPAHDWLQVSTEEASGGTYRLIDLLGGTVLEQVQGPASGILSVGHLPRGLYFLELSVPNRPKVHHQAILLQ